MRRWSVVALTVALTACSSDGGTLGVGGVVAKHTPLPRLLGEAVQGSRFDTGSLAGRPAVLNVWATWCAPCRREQPALMRLHRRYGDAVAFAGIDYRDDGAAAKAWVRQYGVTYASLSDPSGRTARSLGYPYLPDTYVIDAAGTIRFVVFGQTNEQQLGGLIDQVIAASASPSGAASPGIAASSP